MVATVSRCEGVCNQTGEPSVTFCERGEMVERVTDILVYKKIGTSITRSDVAERMGFEPMKRR